jgi:hypothetical protein
MAESFIADVKEMARGVTWVKFLVKFRRMVCGETGSETAIRLHGAWLDGRKGPQPFACGDAKLQRFNFDDDKVVFTFKTEPYSMKSNDYFRYVFDFGKWVDGHLTSAAAQAKPKEPTLDIFNPDWKRLMTLIPASADSGLTIRRDSTPMIRPKPVVEIDSEMEVRSFISRITNK